MPKWPVQFSVASSAAAIWLVVWHKRVAHDASIRIFQSVQMAVLWNGTEYVKLGVCGADWYRMWSGKLLTTCTVTQLSNSSVHAVNKDSMTHMQTNTWMANQSHLLSGASSRAYVSVMCGCQVQITAPVHK